MSVSIQSTNPELQALINGVNPDGSAVSDQASAVQTSLKKRVDATNLKFPELSEPFKNLQAAESDLAEHLQKLSAAVQKKTYSVAALEEIKALAEHQLIHAVLTYKRSIERALVASESKDQQAPIQGSTTSQEQPTKKTIPLTKAQLDEVYNYFQGFPDNGKVTEKDFHKILHMYLDPPQVDKIVSDLFAGNKSGISWTEFSKYYESAS